MLLLERRHTGYELQGMKLFRLRYLGISLDQAYGKWRGGARWWSECARNARDRRRRRKNRGAEKAKIARNTIENGKSNMGLLHGICSTPVLRLLYSGLL